MKKKFGSIILFYGLSNKDREYRKDIREFVSLFMVTLNIAN